ncbi:uncharacterized protein ACIBXB_018333 [Morphnus guianensis]
MTVPGPTAWKDPLKRGKQESFPKPASYSWTLGTSKYWKLVIQAASCRVSPAQRHEMQRLQEGCVQEPIPRGLSALSHWASLPTSAGDGAETHHSRARNPHHDAQAERQGWMHLDKKLEVAASLRKRKKGDFSYRSSPCSDVNRDTILIEVEIKQAQSMGEPQPHSRTAAVQPESQSSEEDILRSAKPALLKWWSIKTAG